MPDEKLITLAEVRAQIAAREKELAAHPDEYGEPVGVLAREEALERVCDALGYLQRSLEEVQAAKAASDAALAQERDTAALAVSDTVRAKGEMLRLDRELKFAKERAEELRGEVEAQRLKKQQAVAQAEAMRAELDSLRMARREVDRQMEAATDGPGSPAPAAPAAR